MKELRETQLQRCKEAWLEYRTKIFLEKAEKKASRYEKEVTNLKKHPRAHRNQESDLWRMWRKWSPSLDMETKLSLLREMSTMVYDLPRPAKSLAKRRKKFWNRRFKLLKLTGTECLVCGRPADVRHHVVQLQHGGANMALNMCPLCHPCHSLIHPWLDEHGERRD